MSASDALTIWILSTAMKAPSVAPATASQVFAETVEAAEVGAAGRAMPAEFETDGAAVRAGWSAVMGVFSSCGQFERMDGRFDARCFAASRSATTAALVLTVGSADMPGRNRPVRL